MGSWKQKQENNANNKHNKLSFDIYPWLAQNNRNFVFKKTTPNPDVQTC